MTLYREATDECVQGYGHAMMDSKCAGCGARNIFVVPVEPDYDEAKDALDLIDAYLSIVRNVLGIGETQ